MDVNNLIQGLLGGLIFAVMGYGLSKIGGRKTKKIERELMAGFSDISLSIKEKTAILLLLMKIAECDGKINSKESIVLQSITNLFDYNINDKETYSIGIELDTFSVSELSGLLINLDLSQKEWLVKTIITLIESDKLSNEQEIDFIQPILVSIGITKSQYNEINNKP